MRESEARTAEDPSDAIARRHARRLGTFFACLSGGAAGGANGAVGAALWIGGALGPTEDVVLGLILSAFMGVMAAVVPAFVLASIRPIGGSDRLTRVSGFCGCGVLSALALFPLFLTLGRSGT